MVIGVVEHQVALAQLRRVDWQSMPAYSLCIMRQRDVCRMPKHIVDKAAAIEPGVWRMPAIFIRGADQTLCIRGEFSGHGGAAGFVCLHIVFG